MPTPLYASARAGTRYHLGPWCEGLNSTNLAGDAIPQVTRAECISRKLLPCAICKPPQVTLLAVVT